MVVVLMVKIKRAPKALAVHNQQELVNNNAAPILTSDFI